jgi:hypothetical protein
METAAAESSFIDKVAEWYESAVPIRVGAVVLAPVTAGISAVADQAIVSTFAFLRRARLRAFRDELVSLNLNTTEQDVHSSEFIEAFVATASRVERTKRKEKIALFARLFGSYWRKGTFTSEGYDEYEEELSIVDELSYREFMVLCILHKLEQQHPMYPGMNRLQRARVFWNDFEKEAAKAVGVRVDEVQGYLQRLSRTGLYQIITGAYLDYEGGLGHLTPRFERLKERLDI